VNEESAAEAERQVFPIELVPLDEFACLWLGVGFSRRERVDHRAVRLALRSSDARPEDPGEDDCPRGDCNTCDSHRRGDSHEKDQYSSKYRWIVAGSLVLSSARRRSTRAFCGFSPSDATSPFLSSSTSTFRPTRPVATREERTETTPFFACAESAWSADAVMLPLPTPAMTIPLAPAAAAALINTPSMFSVAMMMSTRGSTVFLSTLNSELVVFLPCGAR